MIEPLDDRQRLGEPPNVAFQVIADTHLRADPDHPHNRNLMRALDDIRRHAPDSAAVVHVGDVTDHGDPGEYEEWRRIWSVCRSAGPLPEPLCATGNHDVGSGDWQANMARFMMATGTPAPYFERRIGGYPLLFLGTEAAADCFCRLSGRQLAWLESRLESEEREAGRQPVFLFLHQPLLNTVAGSLEEQKWFGVTEDAELRSILAKHPNVLMFTGHTHWEMESRRNAFDGNGTLPAMFNAASVAYLWTDDDERKTGSQGYYVEVYDGQVRVRGRNFERGEWIEGAQYVVRCPPASPHPLSG